MTGIDTGFFKLKVVGLSWVVILNLSGMAR